MKGQQSRCFLLYPCRCSWAVTVSICLICNVPNLFFSDTDDKIKSKKTPPRNLPVFGNEFLQFSELIPADSRGWKPPWLLGDAGSVAAVEPPLVLPLFVPKIRAGMYWKHHPGRSDCPQPPAAAPTAPGSTRLGKELVCVGEARKDRPG